MTTTTTTRAGNTPQTNKVEETVLSHTPLQRQGKAQQECWANFGLSFQTQGGKAFLQPGQFLPVWSRTGSQWRCKTPCRLDVVSAFVIEGRYMIRGGDNKLSSHPEIQDWGDDTPPVRGQASELRFPGGVRRVNPSNLPMLASNAGNYEGRAITAKAFHDGFNSATLHEGCPIELVCRFDQVPNNLPLTARTIIDVVRGDTACGWSLPIPMVLSNEEEVVLKDYPQNWTKALEVMLSYFGVAEVGVMYKASGEELVEDISHDRPNEVYRNALIKGDLGFSTLDPSLYERMLPFSTGNFDAGLISGV